MTQTADTPHSPVSGPTRFSGIRDNHSRGSVADFLRQQLRPGADLDLVTAYFTVFAYDRLRMHLDQLGRIRLLFDEAAFIKNLDPENTDGAAYVLRQFVLPEIADHPKTDSEFELVTWLVLLDASSAAS